MDCSGKREPPTLGRPPPPKQSAANRAASDSRNLLSRVSGGRKCEIRVWAGPCVPPENLKEGPLLASSRFWGLQALLGLWLHPLPHSQPPSSHDILLLSPVLLFSGYAGSLLLCAGSIVRVHGLSFHEACGILVPQPGIEPASPALEGRFFTTEPPGKSLSVSYEDNLSLASEPIWVIQNDSES